MNVIVSIIIPHHNNSKILIDCINSLYKSKFKKLEIIVVDNASIDSSYDDIMTAFSNVIIKKSDINLGYAGGCNLGAQIANGKYLLFLNNDTIMDKDCIESLVNRIESKNEISSVQPKILNIDNKSYFDYAGASGGFIDYLVFPFARGRIFDHIEKDQGQYDSAMKIFWASGAAFLTKKDIFIRSFFAPNHTYDLNTLKALRDSGIEIVIDGYGLFPYHKFDLLFIPQLFYREILLPFGIQSTQIHVNYWDDKYFLNFENFINKNYNKIVDLNYILNLEKSNFLKNTINYSVEKTLKAIRFFR